MAGVIAVFGASGNTGQAVIAAARTQGLRVRGLYRPGSEPHNAPDGLEVVTGDLTSAGDVQRALTRTDGAIVVFGPRLGGMFSKPPEAPQPFCAPATRIIVAQMRELGIRRLVCQTGAMAGNGVANWSWFVRRFVRRYRRIVPAIASDRDEQESVVQQSGLDWTVVRPFRISGGHGVGRVRVAPAIRINAFTSVPRDDLAQFLVEEASAGRFHNQTVYVVKA